MTPTPLVACPQPAALGAFFVGAWLLFALVPFALKRSMGFIPGLAPLPMWRTLGWTHLELFLYAAVPLVYVEVAGDLWNGALDPDFLGGLGILLVYAASTAVHSALVRWESDTPTKVQPLVSSLLYALPMGAAATAIYLVIALPASPASPG